MTITICNLQKSFGDKTAVDIPDFSIASGDILGLVGNNGAGKTTLFRLMLDLLKADKGSITFTGSPSLSSTAGSPSLSATASPDGSSAPDAPSLSVNPAESEDWKTFTGAYIDDGFLIDFLTPEEYFDFIAKVNNIDKETLRERLEAFAPFMAGEILEQNKYIRDFSAGNKQKVGIIAAMLKQPQVLILDEPFNFLDPSSQNILKKMLVDYAQASSATILISSHNLQHTVEISTRIALMEHGHIVKDLPNNAGTASQELEDYFSR